MKFCLVPGCIYQSLSRDSIDSIIEFSVQESLTLGEGDKMDKMINVKRTIAEFRRWPGIVDGYTNLTLFTGFFVLYVFILLAQQDIPNSHKLDFMVRSALIDQDGALSKVNTEGTATHMCPDSKFLVFCKDL
jgi:hypothetical protein